VPLIPAFSRRYPGIELELRLDDALSDMIAGGYDVGIRAGEARDGSMVMREVAPLNFVICGAPSYLAERGVPLTIADLSKHNCLRLRGRGPAGRALEWRLGPAGAVVSPPIKGNFLAHDIITLVTAAAHGQGLAFAPFPWFFRCSERASCAPYCRSASRSWRASSFTTQAASISPPESKLS
jgi:DNA-binding transcriptional LysR family regulator